MVYRLARFILLFIIIRETWSIKCVCMYEGKKM